MNTSSSFVRCGVFCTYLSHTPWTIDCALALFEELGLLGLAGAAGVEGAGAVPVGAGVRCFGAIVNYPLQAETCSEMRSLGTGGQLSECGGG